MAPTPSHRSPSPSESSTSYCPGGAGGGGGGNGGEGGEGGGDGGGVGGGIGGFGDGGGGVGPGGDGPGAMERPDQPVLACLFGPLLIPSQQPGPLSWLPLLSPAWAPSTTSSPAGLNWYVLHPGVLLAGRLPQHPCWHSASVLALFDGAEGVREHQLANSVAIPPHSPSVG